MACAELLEKTIELDGFRLAMEFDALVIEPTEVRVPRVALAHDIDAHYLLVGQQAQQAELSEAAEKESIVLQVLKPSQRRRMMNMTAVSQGEPDPHQGKGMIS